MSFDLGNLGGLIPAIEERFGRRFTSSVLFLGVLAFTVLCFGVIYRGAVKPIYSLVKDALPNVPLPQVNFVYVLALVAVAALLFPALQYFVHHRRVPQSVVDQLAELRKTAIDDILNGRVTTDAQLDAWKARELEWRTAVSKILKKHFPKAEVLGFESLGVIQPVGFPHAFNNEHNFELSMFAKRLSILEDIIRRHTR